MPGFLTHYIGGQSALRAVGSKISEYVSPASKLYNLGTQGPDIFFYYISGFLTKRIRGVGTQMHDSGLGLYFMYLADLIKNSKSPAQRQILFAYVAGFLVHYAVDVHAHGYVFGKTQAETGMKESARHRHFETSVDVLMLKRMYGLKPKDFNQRKLISPKKIHLRVAADAMSEAVREVYHRDIGPIDVYRAMEAMAQFTGYLESSSGRRKRWIGHAEDMMVRSRIISALVHMQEVTDGCDYLNTQKLPWNAPWAADETRTESFVDLFEAAVAESADMIAALYAYTHEGMSREELAAKIRNRSLKTGLDSDNMINGIRPIQSVSSADGVLPVQDS